MATTNSAVVMANYGNILNPKGGSNPPLPYPFWVGVLLVWLLANVGLKASEEESADFQQFRAFAVSNYLTAKGQFQATVSNAVTAWQFGRACFELAEFPTNNAERVALAEEGMAAARQAIILQSNLAEAHYYLGMNVGQLARVKLFSGLWLVKEMEDAFKLAASLNPRVDFAGPDRCLGLLYRDAPGWPISVGSRSKARQHLQKAVQVAPGFPDNQLNLLESHVQWEEWKSARIVLTNASTVMVQARTNLVGPGWTSSWQDWEARFKKVKARLEPPKNGK